MMLSPTLARRPYTMHRSLALLSLLLVVFVATLPMALRQHVLPLVPSASPAAPASRPTLPTIFDLPQALQYQVSATLGGDDPAYKIAAATDGSYHAASPAQQLDATLGAAGMTLRAGGASWRVGLAAWGRADAMRPPGEAAPAQATANQLELRYAGLRAWYRNGPLGLQQGWTLAARPAGIGPLALALSSGGDLRPALEPDGRAIALRDPEGATALRYAGLLAYDASGRELPARFVEDAGTFGILVDDRGAAYPLTIDPWAQSGILTASDGASAGGLGPVALSADRATVVVGVPEWVTGYGAAYVFVRPASGWANATQVARLTAWDGASGVNLGTSVAVSAEGNTVVAGAPGRDNNQGAAYVFVRPGGGWTDATQAARLTASDGASGDALGLSVALSADGATVVAGAPQRASLQGAAYVFVRPGGSWTNATEAARLTASDGVANDFLGRSLALSADGNTVVAGAPWWAYYDYGATYVFVRSTSGWANAIEAARLTASDGQTDANLGTSVALSADGNTVVAGAPRWADYDYGTAYVFVRPGGGWANATQAARLTASDGAANDNLGTSVALSADGATVVAGAPQRASLQGAAYVFVRPGGSWTNASQVARLTASDGVANDQLGRSLALSADGNTVVAGAPGRTTGQGAAYVFVRPVITVSALGRPSRAGTPASFVLTSNDPRVGSDLPVSFTLGGSAVLNTDYTLNGASVNGSHQGSAVIPTGTSSITLTVTPVTGALPIGSNISLTLTPGADYVLGATTNAGMTILPSVSITAVGSPSRYGPKPGTFTVTRTGATGQPLTVSFAVGGTAKFGDSDGYTISGFSINGSSGSVTIPAGQASASFSITPTSTAKEKGTISFSLADTDPAYVAYSPMSAGLTIDGDPPPRWLVLLYLAGDDVAPDSGLSSLTDSLAQLRDSLPYNPDARIVVLFDGNKPGDSALYLRTPAGLEDVASSATSVAGWIGGFPTDHELDSGNITTLQNFIRWARNTYPGSERTMLAIVDHGGGWAPELGDVPQPIPSLVQSGGTRGLSQDRPSRHSLSTHGSGEAFKGLGGAGHVDVLFLDACLMGMIESTYELRSYADYIIAGENLLWSAYPYDTYLAATNLTAATTPRTLARQIVNQYNAPPRTDEPFTIAAIESGKLDAVTAAVENLGTALLAANPTPIRQAYSATQKFDYDSSLQLDAATDGYVDLLDFATRLQQHQLAAPEAQAVADAVRASVVLTKTVSGTTKAGWPWDFGRAGGLSIYLPLGERDCRPTGPLRAAGDPVAIKPCNLPTANVGTPIIEPQLAYYVMPGQLAFTSAGGAPHWAELLRTLDRDTPDRTKGDYGETRPQTSRSWIHLPMLRH